MSGNSLLKMQACALLRQQPAARAGADGRPLRHRLSVACERLLQPWLQLEPATEAAGGGGPCLLALLLLRQPGGAVRGCADLRTAARVCAYQSAAGDRKDAG